MTETIEYPQVFENVASKLKIGNHVILKQPYTVAGRCYYYGEVIAVHNGFYELWLTECQCGLGHAHYATPDFTDREIWMVLDQAKDILEDPQRFSKVEVHHGARACF